MNLMQKTAKALGGIFFAVLLIVALAPKATRGIAAALVQVTNTTSNPVPNRDLDNISRNLKTLTLLGDSDHHFGDPTIFPRTPFVVPAGKRFVALFLSGSIESTDSVLRGALLTAVGQQSVSDYFPLTLTGTFNSYEFFLPISTYSDAGGSVFLNLQTSSGNSTLAFEDVTLRGYLVDCTGACQ
jgi:hypothetical protein